MRARVRIQMRTHIFANLFIRWWEGGGVCIEYLLRPVKRLRGRIRPVSMKKSVLRLSCEHKPFLQTAKRSGIEAKTNTLDRRFSPLFWGLLKIKI